MVLQTLKLCPHPRILTLRHKPMGLLWHLQEQTASFCAYLQAPYYCLAYGMTFEALSSGLAMSQVCKENLTTLSFPKPLHFKLSG